MNIFQIPCYDLIKYVLYCVLNFSCAPLGKILSDSFLLLSQIRRKAKQQSELLVAIVEASFGSFSSILFIPFVNIF